MRAKERDPDRWMSLPMFLASEGLSPDDLLRFAEAGRLPPRAWAGRVCMVDRSVLFNWRQVAEAEGLLPPVRAKAEAAV